MSESLLKNLKKRRKELENSGGRGYKYFIFKEETVRMRPLFTGEDQDWAIEATFFYLGKKLGGYISPATFGEKCPIMKLYEKLSGSDSDEDKEFAKTFRPKKRYFVPHIKFKDLKGEEIDKEQGAKLALLTNDQYKNLLDLFLDPEQGDFTDPNTGYDIKYKRTGKGQFDTEYSLLPCKPSKAPKEFRGPYDVEKMMREIIPTYEAAKEIKEKFLNGGDEEDEDEKPKKKSKKDL